MFRSLLVLLLLAGGGFHARADAQQAAPDELIQYIRDARKAGLKTEEIEKNAIQAGWAKPLLDQALATELRERTATPAAPAEKGKAPAEGANPAGDPTAPPKDTKVEAQPTLDKAAATGKDTKVEGQPIPDKAAIPDSVPAGGVPAAAVKAALPAASIGVKPPIADKTLHDEYRIGEGDSLQISVWGEPAASVGGVVRPDGMITMPLIKDVHVAGLTPAEAEKVINEPLSKVIKGVDVTVIVTGINSKKIYLIGAVKKEGPISYTYRMTIMQALSEAGGLTDYAKKKKIYVLRNENGRQFKLYFDYDAVLRGERMDLNHALIAGDTIVVPH